MLIVTWPRQFGCAVADSWRRHRSACGVLLLILTPLSAVAQEPAPGTERPAAPAEQTSEEPAKPIVEEAGGEARDDEESKRLLDRRPFDQITLDAENNNAVLKIAPVENVPATPKPTDRLRIRLLLLPDREFDVEWQHITEYKRYDQLVFDEAQKLVQQKNFNEAFEYFDYLLRRGPLSASLKQAIVEFLYANAGSEFSKEKDRDLAHALAVLEELIRFDPQYRQAQVLQNLGLIADALVADYVARGDYRNARGLIVRLRSQYDASQIPTLAGWVDRLSAEAAQRKQQVDALVAQGQLREAGRFAREMMFIWPDLEGATELALDLARRYPVVFVAVSEPAKVQGLTRIDSWSARRTGRLTQRTLLEFLGAGPEGGQYACGLGTFLQSDDRRQLLLELRRTAAGSKPAVTGHDISRRLLAMADPNGPLYSPQWAALASGVRVDEVYNVTINLRRPHVIPEALLQVPIDLPPGVTDRLAPSEGPYVLASSDDTDSRFTENPKYRFSSPTHPAEVVERYFSSSQEAVDALRRGDIDIVDYLFPADAARLVKDKSLTVEPYALPSIHVLVPSNKNVFTANQTFRRAIALGINREAILNQELLGNEKLPGYRLISGPFPLGQRDNDPLAYAYNDRVRPYSFDPRLAIALREIARRELEESAKKRQEPVPELKPLVLGYPANEVARVACQAIAQYLQVSGIVCELKELSPGVTTDAEGEFDLLYVQAAVWEPVIDARRLLAPTDLSAIGNEYIGMALRRLDSAKNWREARERLHELHRITHEQVAVIPLWQTVDYFAFGNNLQGVGSRPVTLYQNVEQWRVTARIPQQ